MSLSGIIKTIMIARIFNQKYKLLVISLILLLGTLTYSNTLHSSFHLDDIGSIVNNLAIRNILNLQAIWNFWPTRFITYFSVAFNYHLSQLNVFSYHLFNLAVHLSSGVLVWWFMLLTFSTPAMKAQKITKHAKLIALFVGLVFITHPIQTQGVTYIIQRAASLVTLFYLVSLSLYVKSRLLQQQGESLVASRLFYYGSLIAVVMAMFTKEVAITLPLMVLFYETCFLKRKEDLSWKYLIPFFMTLLIIPLTMFLTKSVDFIGMRRLSEDPSNISSWQYLFTQLRVIVIYLRLIFIPINQNLDYYYPIAKNLTLLPILASFILLVSILTIAIKIFSKYSLISFGIFWFFLTLLPESSVIPIKDVIFEHRLYLPMVGFSFFLVSLVYYLFENKTLKSMVVVLLIIISCYAVLTYRRNFIWQDEFTLWNDIIHKSPKKARPYNIRGLAYYQQGSFTQAISDYNKAIEIYPDYAEAYNNRGNAYVKQGSIPQAISDLSRAIEINPNHAEVYYNRGNAYVEQGSIPQAISDLSRAIEINPNYVEAYNNRGNAYVKQDSIQQAISDYNKAIEIYPDYAEAYNNRGNAYVKQGSIQQAISDFNKAIEINSNYAEPYYNRGTIYGKQGNFTQAVSDYNKAIEINPIYFEAYNNRGIAYCQQSDFTQAISDFNKAIAINPNYVGAYDNRRVVYYLRREYDKAWADVHQVERLGCAVNLEFLTALKKASGRDK